MSTSINKNKINQLINAKLIKKEKRGILNSNKRRKKLLAFYKDLKNNHNNSWYEEVYERNKHNLGTTALFYRNTEISYYKMFNKVDEIADSLKKSGVEKGMEIPICMSNTPELIYVLLAASKIGAKANIFGADFDKEYIKEIINNTNSEILIATDDNYDKIKDILDNTNIKKKVIASLTDSLPNNKDPYEKWDNSFYCFENKVPIYKKEDSNVLSFNQFIEFGKDYYHETLTPGKLNDEFLITYTSGSTHTGRPKALIHRNRSLVAMARAHDVDFSSLPSMNHIKGLAYIPSHSNTGIITSISDVLCQKGTVALEPIYHEDFLLLSLMINNVNMVSATRSHWIQAAKNSNNKQLLPNLGKLRDLYVAISVGEPTEKNELKFIDEWLKKMEAGLNHLKRPIGPTRLSVGGGDCEHGGLYFTLFKSLMDKLSLKGETGLKPFLLAKPIVLKEDGSICKPYELGRLAADSICTMKKYKDNDQATEEFYIKDKYGRKHGDQKVWSYMDKKGTVFMKGRIGNELIIEDKKIPTFEVAKEILKDTKNILSCEVVNVPDYENNDTLVAHVELQPNSKDDIPKIFSKIEQRLQSKFPEEVNNRIYYRLRDNITAFPLTACGKRNNLSLEEEGFTDECFKPLEIDGDIYFLPYNTYQEQKEKNKQLIKL